MAAKKKQAAKKPAKKAPAKKAAAKKTAAKKTAPKKKADALKPAKTYVAEIVESHADEIEEIAEKAIEVIEAQKKGLLKKIVAWLKK